jgi:hypothetical protein
MDEEKESAIPPSGDDDFCSLFLAAICGGF